jgi:hypothetical protein
MAGPCLRCAVLFIFAVRRDSRASNPSLSNASHVWRWLSKETIRSETVMFFTACWEDLHSPFLFGAGTRGIPILSVGKVQTDRSCRARSVTSGYWRTRMLWQPQSIAGPFWMLYPGEKKKFSGSTRSSSQWIRYAFPADFMLHVRPVQSCFRHSDAVFVSHVRSLATDHFGLVEVSQRGSVDRS